MRSMKSSRAFQPIGVAVALFALVSMSGCAKGPLRGLAFLNPQAMEIIAEEEKIAKSWGTVKDEMGAFVDGAIRGGKQQQKIAAERLQRFLSEEHPTIVRLHATDLLGKLDPEIAFNALAKATEDSEVDVRTMACRSLGENGDQQSLQKLREVIGSDSNQDVQIAATRALGKIRHPNAVAALKEALASNQPAIQVSATEALKGLTGKDFGFDIPKWESYLASQRSQLADEAKEKTASFGETISEGIRKVSFLK